MIMDDSRPISSTIDRISGLASEDGKITVGGIFDAIEHLSHSVALLVVALAAVTPLSGIPGFTAACGLIICLISLQMLIGRRHLWLPTWILNLRLSAVRMKKALEWLRRPVRWIERHTRRRLVFLVRTPGSTFLKAACLACGAVMPLLEFVPLTGSIGGFSVSLFAAALALRDGLVALLGLAVVGSGLAFGVMAV